jgi:dipeptidase D
MINELLKDLKSVKVFEYFEQLSQIPRGSGNEKEVSDYLVNFAKNHNLEVIQDKALNVIIRKKATSGYENKPAVIIQGHMDMVCEKNTDTEHDFTKDPLKLRVEGDKLSATGTTLGADNGIAVAMGLAILDSNEIAHPAIELIATTSEETGMDGAVALDPKDVKGRMLINIDSEEEGKLLVSCAGGTTAKVRIKAIWEKSDKNLIPCSIRIRGLKGGHSGMEIDKGRANANKLMSRVLVDLLSSVDFKLASINGGSKHNAIPREMDVVVLIKAEEKVLVAEKIAEWEKVFKNEFRTVDGNLRLEFEVLSKYEDLVLSNKVRDSIVNFLYLVPNGINSMSMDIKGLVESSLNLAIVTTEEKEITFISAIRSSVKSLKDDLFNKINVTAKLAHGEVSSESDYPEWAYNPNSKIRIVFEEVYNKMFGNKPEIAAIHAGLECGLFGEKFGESEMDMISFGPNLYDVHTPDEHLSIASVEKMWNYLIEVLKNIK